ncbi:hypothetical protein CXT76_01645 [Candidatus Parvarchaeota archaeon]|nr:MAG: hypothetical protein CXT76_01645 [Candidatus Parvarchaeota archaeon]HIG51808.1 hypothetical protein [Candidatus Pacearchaeota archaeon]
MKQKQKMKGGIMKMRKIGILLVITLMLFSIVPFGFAKTGNPEILPGDEPESLMVGDVNGDGLVNIADIVRLTDYVNGHKIYVNPISGDVNGDDSINWFDVVQLSNDLFMSSNPVILGDSNNDLKVDVADIVILSHYLTGQQVVVDLDNSDFNQDGEIDKSDLKDLSENLFNSGTEDLEEVAEGLVDNKEISNSLGLEISEIDKELKSVKRSGKGKGDIRGFPITAYYGKGSGNDLEFKFVLFEKKILKTSGNDHRPQDAMTEKRYGGIMKFSTGEKYFLKGRSLSEIKLYVSESLSDEEGDNYVGKARYDFSDETVNINFKDGTQKKLKITFLERKAIKQLVTREKVKDFIEKEKPGLLERLKKWKGFRSGSSDDDSVEDDSVEDDSVEDEVIKKKRKNLWERFKTWFRGK